MTTPATVHHIPLTEIDPNALPRDRTVLDTADTSELINSISLHGLRMPIEVFPLENPEPPVRYGLLSGYRRYHVILGMHDNASQPAPAEPRHATIPAFIRPRAAIADQLVQVVEENAIRADLSPWEQGHIAWLAQRQGIFGTIEEAVATLYRAAERRKRARLCSIAHLVGDLGGHLTAPEVYSLRQLMRLSGAIQAGFGELIRAALTESSLKDPDTQWRLLLPILTEAEQPPAERPRPRPGRPRRLYSAGPGFTVRRERTPDGYTLHFTGDLATSAVVDQIFDLIERQFTPG